LGFIDFMTGFLQSKLYMSVIEDVIIGTREAFLDEGVDEQIQQELRMLWESKLLATKAVETDSGNASANGGSKGFGKSKGCTILVCLLLEAMLRWRVSWRLLTGLSWGTLLNVLKVTKAGLVKERMEVREGARLESRRERWRGLIKRRYNFLYMR